MESDLYNNGYIQGLFSRPSCSKCIFTTLNRVGDITLGDFRERYNVLPEVEGIENLSTVIVNTNKGGKAFQLLDQHMYVYPVTMEDVVRAQARLREPLTISERREEFFDDLSRGAHGQGVAEARCCCGPIRSIWHCLPDRLRSYKKETAMDTKIGIADMVGRPRITDVFKRMRCRDS